MIVNIKPETASAYASSIPKTNLSFQYSQNTEFPSQSPQNLISPYFLSFTVTFRVM
jgi:hypothetical protein